MNGPDLKQNRDNASGKPVMELEKVSFSQGGCLLLDQANLQVFPGEIFLLTGPGGCGLSSFLKIACGILPPSEGTVRIFQRDIHRASPEERECLRSLVGCVFQNGGLLNNMTLLENVSLPLRYHTALREGEVHAMARAKLRLAGVEEGEDRLPAQVSQEIRKRAALARALVMEPRLILFDEPEPTGHGRTPGSIAGILKELKEKDGTAVLVAAHDASLAFPGADRLAFLEKGRIEEVSSRMEQTLF